MISPPPDLRLTQTAILGNILNVLVRKGHRVKTLEHLGLDTVTHLLREAWHACLESWEARGLVEFIEEGGNFAPSYLEGWSRPWARSATIKTSFIFFQAITIALVNATCDSGTSATVASWLRMAPVWALKLAWVMLRKRILRSTDFQ